MNPFLLVIFTWTPVSQLVLSFIVVATHAKFMADVLAMAISTSKKLIWIAVLLVPIVGSVLFFLLRKNIQ